MFIPAITLIKSYLQLKFESNILRDINHSRVNSELRALRILWKHTTLSVQLSVQLSALASSAGFLSMLRGRASLTNALRELTHFSNYAVTTVAELKRGKELSLINLEAGRVRADSERSCACHERGGGGGEGKEGMKDRSGVGTGSRGIDPLVDQSAPKDQYASEMQGLPSRTREGRDRQRERNTLYT